MLSATDLTLRFGKTLALDRVAIEAARGQIVGLLGRNGAGKTSLLRVLLGLLPTEGAGRVVLDGVRLDEDRRRFLRDVGYLPEHLPLYPELRVGEYLGFRAAIRGVPDRKTAIDRVLTSVNLLDHRDRPIRTLSKGMLRRVGLADALLARPKLLLLDEPTDGLDPGQRKDALQLIAQVGAECAVIFSTHVLSEIEGVAQQLCVLEQGRVVASGAPAELIQRGRRVVLEVVNPSADLAAQLAAIPQVTRVTALHATRFLIEATADVREACAHVATAHSGLVELTGGGLEALFAQLTGGGPS